MLNGYAQLWWTDFCFSQRWTVTYINKNCMGNELWSDGKMCVWNRFHLKSPPRRNSLLVGINLQKQNDFMQSGALSIVLVLELSTLPVYIYKKNLKDLEWTSDWGCCCASLVYEKVKKKSCTVHLSNEPASNRNRQLWLKHVLSFCKYQMLENVCFICRDLSLLLDLIFYHNFLLAKKEKTIFSYYGVF